MNTLNQLKDIIHATFDIDPATLQPDAPLADYGLDSLSLAELLFVVEEKFDVAFPQTPDQVDTLADLAALIDRTRSPQPA
jgi:acyl carrier protein